MLSLGLQILLFFGLFLAILLTAYMVYVRISQNRYTEKRFNFLALWSCTTMIGLALFHVFNIPPWIFLLSYFEMPVTPASLPEKTLACLVVIIFVQQVKSWSRTWNGMCTEQGYYSFQKGTSPSIVIDGLSESWRFVRLRRPEPPYSDPTSVEPTPLLPNPLTLEPFHVQALDLILGKWPEYLVPREGWIEEAKCWRGKDTSLDVPILIVCLLNESEIRYDRLRQQIKHEQNSKNCKLIIVLESPISHDATQSLSAKVKQNLLAADAYTFTLESLIIAALPLGRYKHAISHEFQQSCLPNTGFSVSEIFVPTRVRHHKTSKDEQDAKEQSTVDLDEYLVEWLNADKYRHIALLGEYGQGKSTAALELAFRLLHDERVAERYQHRVPILVRLTGLSPMATTPEDLLAAWGTHYGLSGRALLALHRAGRTLLIFDAFDEMSNVSDRADRFNHFSALWRYACPGSRILFTGRPNFFLDDEELKRALGISEHNAVGPYCAAIHIEPFSKEQIAKSLRWLPNEEADGLAQVISRLPRLKEIAERPSLLFQLSQLWHYGRINLHDGMLESAAIIANFVDYSLERQVAKQITDISSVVADRNFIGLRQSELKYFTTGCAVAALSEGRSNFLSGSAFKSTMSELWSGIGETDEFPSKASEGGALAMSLKERYSDQADPIEACQQAVRTHGVIEHDPARSGVYKFSHKSFAEVLSAEVVAGGMLENGTEAQKVWNIERPTELIQQDAIFQFCHDLVVSKYGRAATVSEHSAFANISGMPDNVVTRVWHALMRSKIRGDLRFSKWANRDWKRIFILLLLGFRVLSPIDLFDGRKMQGGLSAPLVSFSFGLSMVLYGILLGVLVLSEPGIDIWSDGAVDVGSVRWIELRLLIVASAIAVGFVSIFHIFVRYIGERLTRPTSLGRCILLSYLAGIRASENKGQLANRIPEFDEALSQKREGRTIV